MTLALITNIVFAAVVIVTIPGMLAFAIRSSRRDAGPVPVAERRQRPRPAVEPQHAAARGPARTRSLAS
jgi:hypothetical protein